MMTQVNTCAVVLLVLSALVAVTQGHICLMDPPQRGGFNVSDPGDISCFQPTGPCGTAPVGTPQIVLGGTGYAVRLQQNLNHYNPGWPGFIDVAWAMGSNPSSSDFITLATIPDYWPHLQAQQTNFSIPITLPNINCDRCTLRVRYNPHKPTEPVFHNCADIKIVTPVKQPKGRLFGWAQSNGQDSFLVEINLDGSLKKLAGPLPVRLDSKKQGAPLDTFTGFANGLIAVDKRKQQLYMIGYNVSNTLDDNTQPKPSTWVHFDLSQNQFIGASPIVSPTPNAQWVAVVTNNGGTTYPALVVELVRVIGSGYKFQVRNVNYYGGVSAPIGNFPFDNTFVNFFWSEFDENKQILYILSGDENSLFELNVRLYSLNTATGQVSYVNVDNSKYTVTSIHVDSATGNLYTLSPGLYPQTKAGQWTVVSINPSTGGVTPMGAGRGLLEPYADWYGGGVYGGNSILSSSYILYQFQKPYSGATVLSMIDIAASKTTYSTTLNTGVNNPLTLQSVTFLPQ